MSRRQKVQDPLDQPKTRSDNEPLDTWVELLDQRSEVGSLNVFFTELDKAGLNSLPEAQFKIDLLSGTGQVPTLDRLTPTAKEQDSLTKSLLLSVKIKLHLGSDLSISARFTSSSGPLPYATLSSGRLLDSSLREIELRISP